MKFEIEYDPAYERWNVTFGSGRKPKVYRSFLMLVSVFDWIREKVDKR